MYKEFPYLLPYGLQWSLYKGYVLFIQLIMGTVVVQIVFPVIFQALQI